MSSQREDLNEYTKRYRHGENPHAATESINDAELQRKVKWFQFANLQRPESSEYGALGPQDELRSMLAARLVTCEYAPPDHRLFLEDADVRVFRLLP